ncbi:proline oxidase [Grosmannia clavigera kw1407]|uniref:Proline dehydrogenase n=1 Tax=Grosmannia clavigera (strain kw1407 / UAMH 11150) TaxID=655863 RepID=F0XMR1_GROCL|nr:proline oxidase [Grosmannia clavigera kw1407]EFX01442.1 proline oxidase [Grosmannia clavigera kw1407]
MPSVAPPRVRLKAPACLQARSRPRHQPAMLRALAVRLVQTTRSRQSLRATSADGLAAASRPNEPEHKSLQTTNKPAPLSVLPLTNVMRSYFVTSISSSKILLPPSLALTTWIANSNNALLNPDRNPILHYILKKTFYAQFCAGETAAEARKTIAGLKNIGFSGVILGYAKEAVLQDGETESLSVKGADEATKQEIASWTEGTLETVRIAAPGDFVALKFTGAGREALYHLSERKPPAPALAEAVDNICDLALSRNVRLLFDAEQASLQKGIDDWTLAYMRKYNAGKPALVYGTYQAYLKSTPSTLSGHLREARDGGFSLGIKLVRGAYIGSDPRQLIHDTKANTDMAYDGIAEAVLRQKWQAPLVLTEKGSKEAFPNVSLVVASHNAVSVRKAKAIVASGEAKIDVAFGQLQGMADEVSCTLIPTEAITKEVAAAAPECTRVRPYKYLVWGSTGECMKYLLRRAHENRDAVQRTKDGRDAMRAELWRRTKSVFGLA